MDSYKLEFNNFVIQIGLKVGYYRRLSGMTQEHLSEMIDVSLSYIGKLEAKSQYYCPSLRTLHKIAKALGVDAAKLIDVEHD